MWPTIKALGTFELQSDREISKSSISEQVPIGLDVIGFRILSIERFSTHVSRSSRSQELSHYLVNFEISLAASDAVEIDEQLSGIFGKIDYFTPNSILVIDHYTSNEEG